MSIPNSEQRYWHDALDRIYAATLGEDAPEEPKPGTPEHQRADMASAMKSEAAWMKQNCPTLWEFFDIATRPRAHNTPFMSPSLPMTSGERMAYSLGIDAVGAWLRSLIHTPKVQTDDY